MASLLDDFNRSNEDPLSGGGDWHILDAVRSTITQESCRLVSNQITSASDDGESMSYWVPDLYSELDEAYATVKSWGIGGMGELGLVVCFDPILKNGYFVQISNGYVQFYYIQDNNLSDVGNGSGATGTINVGDEIRLTCDTSTWTLSLLVNGSVKRTCDVSATKYPSGKIGAYCYYGAAMDDFGGGAGLPATGPLGTSQLLDLSGSDEVPYTGLTQPNTAKWDLVSHALAPHSTSDTIGWIPTETYGPDCEIWAHVAKVATGNYLGLFLRANGSGALEGSSYQLRLISGFAPALYVRQSGGSATSLGTFGSNSVVDGEYWALTAEGDSDPVSLKAWKWNGSSWDQVGSTITHTPTDTDLYTAGAIGLFTTGYTTWRVNQISGGTAVVPGYTESATITSKTTPSSVEIVDLVDSGTITNKTTLSSSELYTIFDAQTVSAITNISSNEVPQFSDTSIIDTITTFTSDEVFTDTSQKAAPISDVEVNGWLPSDGVSPLYSLIDEISPDGSDYIYAVAT